MMADTALCWRGVCPPPGALSDLRLFISPASVADMQSSANAGHAMSTTDLRLTEESQDCLASYAEIPIAFTVTSLIQVALIDSGLAGFTIREEPVATPYLKDYDAVDSERPLGWQRGDLTNWGFIGAFQEGRRVGGTVVAWKTDGVDMLEGRSDLAVLWDIRVAPDVRGEGIGGFLYQHAEQWAVRHGCGTLKIETQNVNVPACRFYARHGCHLGAVQLHAYDEFPEEVQMLWYKDLSR